MKSCPICQSADTAQIGVNSIFARPIPVRQCAGCHVVFLDLPKDTRFVRDFYNQNYWDQWDKRRQPPHPTAGWAQSAKKAIKGVFGSIGIHQNNYPHLYRFLLQGGLAPHSRILEIGCKNGELLAFFHSRGHACQGVEPDRESAQTATARAIGRISNTTLEEFKTAEKFDLIVMCHVFEHFVEPADALVQCRKMLAPGGRLFISLPDGSNPRTAQVSIYQHPHTFTFDAAALEMFLRRQGWASIHSRIIRYWDFGALQPVARRLRPAVFAPTDIWLLASASGKSTPSPKKK